MIGWLITLAVWSLVMLVVSYWLEWDVGLVVFAIILAILVVVAAIYGTVEFLRYMQSWPFVPQ